MTALINVRMCDRPDCNGYISCPLCRTGKRSAGITLPLAADIGDEQALAILRQELYLSMVSAIDGTQHWMPDGCTFIAHKHTGALTGDPGSIFVAALEGPGADLDALLAGAPPFDPAQTQARAEALNAT